MTTNSPSESVRALVTLDYEKLHDYYIWSLETRSSRVTLYIQLYSIAAAACIGIVATSMPHRYTVCGAVLGVFVILGGFILDRVLSGQVTGIWCAFRLNLLRRIIRTNWKLGSVYRPLPIGTLRPRPMLFGLLKYEARESILPIVGNALAAGIGAFFLVLRWKTGIGLIIAGSTILGVGLLQILYLNRKYKGLRDYLVFSRMEYDAEVRWMSEFSQQMSSIASRPPGTGDKPVTGASQSDWELFQEGWDVLNEDSSKAGRERRGFCFLCVND